MTNVPVERGNTARQQPQVATTDADREAAERILDAQTNGYCVTLMRGDAIEAIARARAEEREACALACGAPDDDPSGDDPCSGNDGDTFDWGVRCASYWNAAAIRARSEGGKA